jgi:WD40 repeat protein
MTRKRKITLIGLAVALVMAAVIVILVLRSHAKPVTPPSTPSPSAAPKPRSLSNEKFGSRPRTQTAANVDVGVLTIEPQSSPSPSPGRQSGLDDQPLGQAYSTPGPTPNMQSIIPTIPPGIRVVPPPLATPTPEPLPTFAPLGPGPSPRSRELGVVYAKGANQKRQIYLRSVERDKDEQIVSSVFDDYGVSFSSATQKIAFYSNEEGPSDTVKSRTKLKVVDLATSKVQTLLSNLPGSWPAAWSTDGKKLAVPTTTGIFIADVTNGTTKKVTTGKNSGAVVWAPGNLKFYFQAEAAPDNNDIYEADAITAKAKPVTDSQLDEQLPAVSSDGSRLTFLRQADGGSAVVVKTLGGGKERVYSETAPAISYLFNLDLDDLIFTQGAKDARLSRFKSSKVKPIGTLTGPVVISWDRDYDHVFVLADDDQGKALFSVDIGNGSAEKIKAGISDTVPTNAR